MSAPVLAGPVAVVATLVVVAGLAKVRRPQPAASSLRSVGVRARTGGVRALGLAEAAAGTGALLLGGGALVGAVALLYLGFAAFVAVAIGRGTTEGCGCFGAEGPPPRRSHLVVNLAAAVVAAAGAATGAWPGLGAVLAAQPLAGLPFLVLVATAVVLLQALLGLARAPATAPRRQHGEERAPGGLISIGERPA